MKTHMNYPKKMLFISSLASVLLLTACANVTKQKTAMDEINDDFNQLNTNAVAQQLVPVAIYDAQKAVNNAKKAVDTKAPIGEQNHLLFVADKKIKLAIIALDTKQVEMEQDALVKEREKALLAAKVMELAQLKGEARAAKLATLEREEALKKTQAELSDKEAKLAASTAKNAAAEEKLQGLETRMAGLETQRTSRGLVATLGGVFFDSGKATLHAGVARNLNPVVDALQQYPELTISIEGHADSTGNDAFNQTLSANRAMSVKNMLTSKGIDAARITTQGFGSAYPIATNDTEAGRQRNRRVEIVFNN